MWKQVLKVILEFLLEEVKKVIPILEEFILAEVKILLADANEFIAGDTFEEAKVKLIDKAFEKVNLPLVFKPFKGLIKKALVRKLDDALEKLLKELNEKIKTA